MKLIFLKLQKRNSEYGKRRSDLLAHGHAALRGLPELFDEVARRNRAKQVAVRLKADGPHELAGTVSRAHHHHDARGGLAVLDLLEKIKRRVLLGLEAHHDDVGAERGKAEGRVALARLAEHLKLPGCVQEIRHRLAKERILVHEHDRDQLAPVHSNHL